MRVAIALGSNVGDRLALLRDAAARIAAVAPVLARSRIWETAPVGASGAEGQDEGLGGAYLNAGVLVEWTGPPVALLDALQAIEHDLGRVRTIPNAPRTIDLDVLWIPRRVVEHPRLHVPHPRLHERAFAIAPLLDLVPDAADPRTGARYAVAPEQGIRLFDALL